MSTDLKELLSAKGLDAYFQLLADEEIDADMVPTLTDGDLKELGLRMGQRKKFLAAFANGSDPAPTEPGQMPAERRQLTVAFCDLVGSTQLATQLDPEDLREVITSYLDTAVAVMKSHGGHLAYTQGDGLMVYFGYPQAHEDDAERALRAALDAVATVQNLKTRAPGPLNVRVGVATGRVVVGDMAGDRTAPQDFVVGETPNLAARMQSLANPGEVIVAGSTERLTSGSFEFEGRGTVAVKGFAEPRAIFMVKGEKTVASRFAARAQGGMHPMVGRAQEIAALTQQWEAACTGQGQVCLVQGPPGMGKSRLVRGLYDLAGGSALEWQCASHLTNRALHPVAAELERTAGISRNDNAETRRAKASSFVDATPLLSRDDLPLLASLVGAESEDDPQFDAAQRARLIVEMLLRRVEATAQNGPALVVLEDAHWSDPTTLEFLDALVAHVATHPILLVLTARPEFSPSVTLSARAPTVFLEPLDPQAGIALVGNVAGSRKMPDGLAQMILDKTDGVPLFVEELTKSILDRVPEDSALTPNLLEQMDIPATLQDSLMSRLDRIGPAKEIAQLGAVIGREFTAPMIEAIAPDGADVGAALAQLEQAELLNRDGLRGAEFFMFNHALVQDTAFESMLRSRRQEVHLALARAMLDKHAAFGAQEPEIIARHCEHGGLIPEAIAHWTQAGQDAVAQTANVAAVTYLESALRLLMTGPETEDRDRTELGLQMTLAAALMSSVGWGSDAVEKAAMRAEALAKSLQDHQTLFGASWIRWTYYFLSGQMADALHAARNIRAMAEAGPPGIPTLAAAHALSFTHYSRGELHECIEAVNWGLPHRNLDVDRAMLPVFQLASGNALHTIAASAYWVLGEDEKAEAARRNTDGISAELGHIPNRTQCLLVSSYSLMFARDWDRLEPLATDVRVMAEENGLLFWTVMCDAYLSVAHMGRGRIDEGLALLNGASEAIRALGAVLTLSQFEICAADALVAQGHPEKALERLAMISEDAHAREEQLLWSEFLRVKGEATCALGHRDEGLKYLNLALEDARQRKLPPLIARAEDSLTAAEADNFVA